MLLHVAIEGAHADGYAEKLLRAIMTSGCESSSPSTLPSPHSLGAR